jgi:ribosomal protein L40E
LPYGDFTNLKPSELNKCPGCGGEKYRTSILCKPCWAAGRKESSHPGWKGGPNIVCPSCGGRKSNGAERCRNCRKSRFEDGKHINAAAYAKAFRRTPEGKRHVRAMNLKKYGLTPEMYDDILRGQDNKCAACGNEETAKNQFGPISMAVDHDHTTEEFRGLLCMRCNRSLGMLNDSVETIEKLLNYRKKFK